MSDQPIVSIRNVSKYFGDFTALDDVSIDIMPGEFFALLGPSGCGKSTLLRIIAGFESPSEGELLLDGKDMTDTPPNKRPINMVFQSYAVFPHMSVEKNVAYGLKFEKGLDRAEIDRRVDEALAQVHLTQFKARMPDQLSGGQRQRVALARALVKRPRVLLLDEPLSALDAKLRDAMRLELVRLQQTVGITFLMVTHDQSEAMAMADRVAVLDKGLLKQVDTPRALYSRPRDAFVADFIGRVNLFDIAAVNAEGATPSITLDHVGEVPIALEELPKADADLKTLQLAVRPENVHVTVTPLPDGTTPLRGRIVQIAYQGESSIFEIALESGTMLIGFQRNRSDNPAASLEVDTEVWCGWRVGDAIVIPRNA